MWRVNRVVGIEPQRHEELFSGGSNLGKPSQKKNLWGHFPNWGGPKLILTLYRSARTSCTTFVWSVRTQEFLLLLLLLLLSRQPCHPLVSPPVTPVVDDHLEGPAFCKWSFRWTGILQMIIRMDRPLANDHLDGRAFCK